MAKKKLPKLPPYEFELLPSDDGTLPREVERAYRRGYLHGWHFATRAVAKGATVAELADWEDGVLWDWRRCRRDWRGDRCIMRPPPTFDRLKSRYQVLRERQKAQRAGQ